MAELRRLSRRQLGLFTRSQARQCGFSPRQIRWRLKDGEWRTVLGKVLAPAELRLGPLSLDRAAPLAVPGGVLAGPSAARVLGLAVLDERIYLAVPPARHPALPGIRYLRTRLDEREVCSWEGAPVTVPNRTIADCLRLLPEADAARLLDRALQRGQVSLAYLDRYLRRMVGHNGLPQLRRLVRAAKQGERSAAERLATGVLAAGGVTGWRANMPIYDDNGLIGVGDLVFEAERLVVEIDGWAFHVTPERFQHDRERQNRLVAAGWAVLRFTWRDLTQRPEYVVATVRSMLEARRRMVKR